MDKIENTITRFNRNFYHPENKITYIGNGSFGGKASGLLRIQSLLNDEFQSEKHSEFEVRVPTLTVLRTNVFDAFLKQNDLYSIAYSDSPDDRIANAFQKAELPFSILGDLRALIADVHSPLAIRSSSLLEDAMHEPFAGIYSTKMTPNNQPDTDTRFQKLVEAIKFVYASTFFKDAKDYMRATPHKTEDEKMAIIIQEVAGKRQVDIFYPDVSGVGRSYNYYAFGNADPKNGIVNLALGLGKTIVDGGLSWSYSPALPNLDPPFGSINEMMKNTQTLFWAVNMGKPSTYNPIKETEYLLENDLTIADKEKNLKYAASTLDTGSGRIVMGIGKKGPRILNFASILRLNEPPLNDLLSDLMKLTEENYDAPVEIEFALNFSDTGIHQFSFLQARPMAVSFDEIDISDESFNSDDALVSSNRVLGNGTENSIFDIIYLKPESFDAMQTQKIALEIEKLNSDLLLQNRKYLLIGFGRWGTSDASAGIPVNWGQITGAKAIVEASLDNINFEQSQGSHFFHNVSGFQVFYFSVERMNNKQIDWDWLNIQKSFQESHYLRHLRLNQPLKIEVDGRSGLGIILKPQYK
ncbi:MAG: hypothetical protein PF484_04730 [Bacteroidales bacterium]|jgi:hypothetical protein|nr:hypothetical protein [Bacteroidales bacterium]